MHSTDDADDGYLGSGKILARSIKKYGKENHTREVIEYLPDRESLAARENEIVNEALLKDTKCMNLTIGGIGGAVRGRAVSEATRKKISVANKGRICTLEGRANMSKGQNGKINIHSIRAIVVDNIEYESVISASKILGIPDRTICTRCKSKYNSKYYYKDSPKDAIRKVPSRSKPVMVNGTEYSSVFFASEATGIHRKTISARCKSDKFPEFLFINTIYQ